MKGRLKTLFLSHLLIIFLIFFITNEVNSTQTPINSQEELNINNHEDNVLFTKLNEIDEKKEELSSTIQISPVFLFSTESVMAKTVNFTEYSPETKNYKTITTFDWNHLEESVFTGGEIYYDNGVFYGTYVSNSLNYLLAIEISSGNILYHSHFARGFVGGITLDQTTGDIHFLNFTRTSYSAHNHTITNSGDWWTFNVNTKNYYPKKIGLVENSNLGVDNYAVVYSPESQSLWALNNFTLYGFNVNEENQIILLMQPEPFIALMQMTINQKTNNIYIFQYSYDFNIQSQVNATVLQVYFGDAPGVAEFKRVCSSGFLGDLSFISVNPIQADIDYASNSLITLLHETSQAATSQQVNGIYTVNLDDCSFTQTVTSAVHYLGVPRFYPHSD